jgi:hypothetical protein
LIASQKKKMPTLIFKTFAAGLRHDRGDPSRGPGAPAGALTPLSREWPTPWPAGGNSITHTMDQDAARAAPCGFRNCALAGVAFANPAKPAVTKSTKSAVTKSTKSAATKSTTCGHQIHQIDNICGHGIDTESTASGAMNSTQSAVTKSTKSAVTQSTKSAVTKSTKSAATHFHQNVTADLHQNVTADLHKRVAADLHKRVTADLHQNVTADVHKRVTADFHKNVTADFNPFCAMFFLRGDAKILRGAMHWGPRGLQAPLRRCSRGARPPSPTRPRRRRPPRRRPSSTSRMPWIVPQSCRIFSKK